MDLPGFYLTLPPRIKDSKGFFKIVLESLTLGHKHNKPLILITQHLTRPKAVKKFLAKVKERKIPVFGDPHEFLPLLPRISNFKKRLEKKKRNNNIQTEYYSS